MIMKYPYTDYNEYNLDWCIRRIRDLSDEWAATHQEWLDMQHSWEDVQTEWENYKKYIDEYFENLDLSQEVSDKIDQMAEDGYFSDLFVTLFRSDILSASADAAGTYTAEWIADNLLQETGYVIDNSLTVQNAAADAKAAGDAINRAAPMIKVNLEPSWFIGGATINTGPAYADNSARAATLMSIFDFDFPVRLVSENANLQFSVYDRTTDSYTSGWSSDFTIYPPMDIGFTIKTVDSSAFKTVYLDDISVYIPLSCAEKFFKATHITIDKTTRYHTYDYDTGLFIRRYGCYTTGDMIGLLQRSHTEYRVTALPYYCEKPIRLYVGSFSNCVTYVFINNSPVSVNQGEFYDIPAKTPFVCLFTSSSSSSTNSMPLNVWLIVDGENADFSSQQLILNMTGTPFNGTGCSFEADDKVFLISNTQSKYLVIDNGTPGTAKDLDHTVGHANSCNYHNGKVYVSDWTDSTLIHVFAVDTALETLTYEKDITIPMPDTYGRCEYYVFDDEKQVIGLGWETGNAATDPNTLVITTWVKTSTGYTEGSIKKTIRGAILQSFTVQDNYIYYVECDSDYNSKDIKRIDIATGITEGRASAISGTLASYEAEGIIPVAPGVFMIADYHGSLYLLAW